jgi:di/tripeptidase
MAVAKKKFVVDSYRYGDETDLYGTDVVEASTEAKAAQLYAQQMISSNPTAWSDYTFIVSALGAEKRFELEHTISVKAKPVKK